jgi:DNA-binding XRE family transcriptional regulator
MTEYQIHGTNLVQLNVQLKRLGTEICTIRKEIKHSQQDMAEWAVCDRRKIAAIESGECLDFELICKVCDLLTIELNINFEIN